MGKKSFLEKNSVIEKNTPVEKNKEYIMNITGMGFEGEGVGKLEDYTVFIPGALFGEKVKVKIVKVNKSYGFGRLIDILEASSKREVPVCGIYDKCGGCQLQHLSYEGQLEFKRQRVLDSIERVGKLTGVTIHETLGMEKPYRYRNKVQLPVGLKEGKVQIGFYAQRSHSIIPMSSCDIQDEVADKAMEITRQWIEAHNLSPYNEEENTGLIRHLMIRRGYRTKEVMVVLVTSERKLPFKEEFIQLITKSIKGVKSIIQNVNSKRSNVILGDENITLWGEDNISDYIGDFRFKISPLSFFQVNPIQTEVLYSKALEYAALKGEETVFDAYCGTGTISLFLSVKAKKVYGVEIVPQAIENAKENAVVNNVNNTEFIVGESEKVIPELIEKGIHAEVVVVDPPRKGCDKVLLEAIAKMQPDRIVYVSCDPGTLGRDLGILDELGYRTLEIQPVDMFPQTAHVETVCLLERK